MSKGKVGQAVEKRLKIIQEYSKIYDLLSVKDTTKKIASSIFS